MNSHASPIIFDLAPGVQEYRLGGELAIDASTPASTPLVSVCVQTYRHEKYVAKCLESICTQRTNFAYEVLVGEDNSDDRTREICIEFKRKYPQMIRLFLHDRSNIMRIHGVPTGRFNLITNLSRAVGKYTAWCDGDDFWRDPDKLQKQVDFLESHAEFSVAFHDAVKIDEDDNFLKENLLVPALRHDRTQEQVVAGMQMPTSSLLFRTEAIRPLPPAFAEVFNGDTFLFSLLGHHGKAAFVDVVPSAYRVHQSSIWSKRDRIFQLSTNLHTCQKVIEYCEGRFRWEVARRIVNFYNAIILANIRQRRFGEAAKVARDYVSFATTELGWASPAHQACWFGSFLRFHARRLVTWMCGGRDST